MSARFNKAVADRKRYVVEYTNWLNDEETVTAVTVTGNEVADDFYVDGYIIEADGKEVIFYASGGIAGTLYPVRVLATTSMGQIKEDIVTIRVI